MGRKQRKKGKPPPEKRAAAPDARVVRESPAKEVPPSATHNSRRAFLWKAWIGLAAVGLAEVVWVILGFLRPRRPLMAD